MIFESSFKLSELKKQGFSNMSEESKESSVRITLEDYFFFSRKL